MSQTDIIHGDRREHRRYDFPLGMRYAYRLEGVDFGGTGRTVDLGRGGVRYQAEDAPPVGASIELTIEWPFLLHNICPLELKIWGKVLRNDGSGTAVIMHRYEFRTCGTRSFHQDDAEGKILNVVA